MDEVNIIDAGILLDIVYDERPMHENAMEFFNRFGNQGLAVESNVNRRCQRSVLKCAGKFVSEFGEFLHGRGEEGNPVDQWDSMDRPLRSTLLESFTRMSIASSQSDGEGYNLFSRSLVNKAKQHLVEMDIIHVREYLQILPAALTDHLSDSIKENFTYLVSLNTVDGKDIVGIRKALYEHISFDSMDTAMTLAGLVCLILYGSPGRKKYNSINFYTGDEIFIEDFKKIREKKHSFIMEDGGDIKVALGSINFEKPY